QQRRGGRAGRHRESDRVTAGNSRGQRQRQQWSNRGGPPQQPQQQQQQHCVFQRPSSSGEFQLEVGGICDCGQNAVFSQPASPSPASVPIRWVPVCGRCGKNGHMAMHCTAPRRFEGNCATCGEYGHVSRLCITSRGFGAGHPHDSVETTSGASNNA
ncbi:unnamed protein product, partial [Pylaiella littoralis]